MSFIQGYSHEDKNEIIARQEKRIAELEAERDAPRLDLPEPPTDPSEYELICTLERDLCTAHARIAALEAERDFAQVNERLTAGVLAELRSDFRELEAERDALQVQIERWRQSYGRQTP